MFSNDEFNSKLHETLAKHIPEITLADIVELDLQYDKNCCVNSYCIGNEKIFFTLVNKVLCVPVDISEPYRDIDRNVICWAQRYVTWERDAATNEFLTGYIGFRWLDVFLFGEDRVDLEDFEETKRILKLHNITDNERTYFCEKLERQSKDLAERGLI